jgi:MFS family permease
MGIMVFNLAKCLCYGVADMISQKVIFAGVFIFLRILTGVSVYMASFSVVHGIRTWFPDNFQLVNSLVTGTASYVGYGTFSFVGAISYDDHGQHSPYLILGGFIMLALALTAMILPRDDQPISTFRSLEDEPTTEQEGDGISEPLSPLVFFPIIGQFLINMTSGYCIITSIPFLIECCGVSSARASSFIFTNFLATAAGFLIAGNDSRFCCRDDSRLLAFTERSDKLGIPCHSHHMYF